MDPQNLCNHTNSSWGIDVVYYDETNGLGLTKAFIDMFSNMFRRCRECHVKIMIILDENGQSSTTAYVDNAMCGYVTLMLTTYNGYSLTNSFHL